MVFLDIDKEYTEESSSSYIIIPVPYDGTSTWGKGSDQGPRAIIEASCHLELYDIETKSEPFRQGIHTLEAQIDLSSPENMVENVKKITSQVLDSGKIPIVLGGEHSVAVGAVRACCRKFPGLSVLQLDAHSDLRQEYLGSGYNHACTMARIKETCPIVQCGIRSMDKTELDRIDDKNIFYARDIQKNQKWIPELIKRLSSLVYITLDLDVFDPAIMPSTGTPEPGGLLWYQVLALLTEVFKKRNVVGFDVTELCPGTIKSADFLAAKLVYKMIAYHNAFQSFHKRRKKR
jgi:agmatinase